MEVEVWRQIDEVFKAVVEFDVDDRADFLRSACGENASLRKEVDALLTADSLEWELIENSAIESGALLFDDEELLLTPGEQLGHYTVEQLLGKGGMGEIYLARDMILNRSAALKLLPFDHNTDEGWLERFRREAETLSGLNHPNIITIYELGVDGDRQFIATELVKGETLRSRLKKSELSTSEILDIAIQTARALAAAHKAGIVHRDIKPENIMLRSDGLVKVLDFGLAKPAGLEDGATENVAAGTDISSGLLLGTVRYMAPEQLAGCSADVRTDVFSFGCVLYEMVTGRAAFDEKDLAKLAESILKNEPPPPLGPLAPIVAKALLKDPGSRYGAIDEILRDLTAVQELESRPGARSPRSSAAFILVVAAAAASAVGFISFRAFNKQADVAPEKAPTDQGVWTLRGRLSSARWQAEPAVLNDTLYVAGGWEGCTPFGDLEAYDPATETWTKRASMITPRGGHGLAALDGKLYAVGGSVDCRVDTPLVEAYDPESDSWSPRAPLSLGRYGHSVAAVNGKLYAISGEKEPRGPYLHSNSEYDPATNAWTERAPIPTARAGAAVAVVDGLIYVLGGSGESGALASVEVYDPKTDKWTSRRPMISPRGSFGASEVDGTIYILGGSPLRLEVEAYDTTADTWTVAGAMPARRVWAHAATFRGEIYYPGGSDGVSTVADVISFRPAAHLAKYPRCPALKASSRAPMPTARNNMTVGEINGVIYAAGGYGTKTRYLAVNEALDLSTNKWSAKAPLPEPRETRGTNNAVVDGRLFVIGGNASGQCSSRNEAYDPAADTWTSLAPMPTARCHLAVVASQGLIYAVGGTNTSGSIEYDTLEIYAPATDSWTTGPPMSFARQDVAAVVMNGLVYVLGGGNPALSVGGELDTVEAYDPQTGNWTTKAPMKRPRLGFAAGELNGKILVMGGSNESAFATIEAYDPANDSWTALPRMSGARGFLSATSVNEKLYAFGGLTRPGPDDPVSETTAFQFVPCSAQ